MGELRLHLAMTAIEPNKLFTTFVVSRKFPNIPCKNNMFPLAKLARQLRCAALRQLVCFGVVSKNHVSLLVLEIFSCLIFRCFIPVFTYIKVIYLLLTQEHVKV
jgi:hypothetical protein